MGGAFESASGAVRFEAEADGDIAIITIDRYEEARNAISMPVGVDLYRAMAMFDDDPDLKVAILTGAGGGFSAGSDLKWFARYSRGEETAPDQVPEGYHSAGPTMMTLGKPVIAAVEGHAVAAGLELACWCDMRVAARDATFGVYCRRWGVPLGDGGTVRLTRIVGQGHALDMILTGRGVGAEEAKQMGLVQQIAEPGQALATALETARHIAQFPQAAVRSDRLSALEQWSLPERAALENENRLVRELLATDEGIRSGVSRFEEGAGRHGLLADGRGLRDVR